VAPELALFAESVRGALEGFAHEREPVFGDWLDERDDALAARLAQLGWSELWTEEDLLEAAVAGAIELGSVAAPVHLVDEPTLGAPLAVGGRVRHGADRLRCASPVAGWGLELQTVEADRLEPTLDSSGTRRISIGSRELLARRAAADRWRAWSAATLGYLAGLGSSALTSSIEHAKQRQQFGAPLAALPAVQQRLADAAVIVDGLLLAAWRAAAAAEAEERSLAPQLLWAGGACREVTASAHQIHGAVGFALETGLHVAYRRAKSVQVWAAAVCRAAG
jgi:Acyl-CoA dehydrogenase, C-terminal domain